MTLGDTRRWTHADHDHLVDALESANIPVLLVVTYQLTGDRRWISDAYRPTRAKGMDENRRGGLPEATQSEIRRAAHDAIVAWSEGAEVAVPRLEGEDLIEVLSFMNGEEVPPEYEEMMSEMLGFAGESSATRDPVIDSDLSVLV